MSWSSPAARRPGPMPTPNILSQVGGHRFPLARNDRGDGLRQPALAALVMLAGTERFAPALGDAEIELLDVLILAQRPCLAVEHDPAILQDITIEGIFER